MAHASTSFEARASTTIAVADVLEEFEEFEDSEPEDDFVTHVENPISTSGDEFDD